MSLVADAPPRAPSFLEVAGAEFERALIVADQAYAMPTYGEGLRLISIAERESDRMLWMICCAVLSRGRAAMGLRA